MNFKDLSLSPQLCETLQKEGYETPTPIQEKAIPALLSGKDLLGCAQTGTGKTAAFALPTIQKLSENPRGWKPKYVRALVLVPTRELAVQVHESFATYGKTADLQYSVVYGGVSDLPQKNKLAKGVDVLVATPGRLLDLVGQRALYLDDVETFILDEADRMLDMGFLPDVKRIIHLLPGERQTMLFSATMPYEIRSLIKSLLCDPVTVEVAPVTETADNIEQSVYMVDRGKKPALLRHLLNKEDAKRVLVFTRTKHGADRVAHVLLRYGINAEAIHGNKSQNARQKSLSRFAKGHARVLVATDIASRGIDIDDISHVINYELPELPETYIHRIGRTARAGASGKSFSFCDTSESMQLRDIERLINRKIFREQLPVLDLSEPPPAKHSEDSRHTDDGRGSDSRRDSYRSQGASRSSGSGRTSGSNRNFGSRQSSGSNRTSGSRQSTDSRRTPGPRQSSGSYRDSRNGSSSYRDSHNGSDSRRRPGSNRDSNRDSHHASNRSAGTHGDTARHHADAAHHSRAPHGKPARESAKEHPAPRKHEAHKPALQKAGGIVPEIRVAKLADSAKKGKPQDGEKKFWWPFASRNKKR